jgi:hypothetical protein
MPEVRRWDDKLCQFVWTTVEDEDRRLAVRLYQKFWARSGWESPTPFDQQAQAIQDMWLRIARDALHEIEEMKRGR